MRGSAPSREIFASLHSLSRPSGPMASSSSSSAYSAKRAVALAAEYGCGFDGSTASLALVAAADLVDLDVVVSLSMISGVDVDETQQNKEVSFMRFERGQMKEQELTCQGSARKRRWFLFQRKYTTSQRQCAREMGTMFWLMSQTGRRRNERKSESSLWTKTRRKRRKTVA